MPEEAGKMKCELDFIFDEESETCAEEIVSRFVQAGAFRLSETRGVIELLYARSGRSLLVAVERKPLHVTKYRAYVHLWPGKAERMKTYLSELLELARKVNARVYDSQLAWYVTEYTVDEFALVCSTHRGERSFRFPVCLALPEKARRQLKNYLRDLQVFEVLDLRIEYLDLTIATLLKLRDLGIYYVAELVQKTDEELIASGLGDRIKDDVLPKLKAVGLTLGVVVSCWPQEKLVQ